MMGEAIVIMTEAEFCKAAHISRTLAWQLRTQGRLPHARVNGKILYTSAHLQQFLAAHERPATDPQDKQAV